MYIEMLIKKLEKEIETMQASERLSDTQKLADCIGLYSELYELQKQQTISYQDGV